MMIPNCGKERAETCKHYVDYWIRGIWMDANYDYCHMCAMEEDQYVPINQRMVSDDKRNVFP